MITAVDGAGPSPARRVAGVFARGAAVRVLCWIGASVAILVALWIAGGIFKVRDRSYLQSFVAFAPAMFFAWGGTVRGHIPRFVANGIARRDTLTGIWPLLLGVAAGVALLTAVLYAVEGVVFGAYGWEHTLVPGNLYVRPDQYALIAVSSVCVNVGCLVTGVLLALGFARWDVLRGFLFAPVALVPGALAMTCASMNLFVTHLPAGFPGGHWPTVAALAVAVPASVVGILASPALARGITLDNGNLAWWR
jgi:hypothetical protein